MKFGALNRKAEKNYRIKKLDGGVNTLQLANGIADNELSAAENMEFCDGVLKTRAGLSAAEDDIINCDMSSLYDDVSYYVTDATVSADGKCWRLAYELYDDYTSHTIYYILLIGSDGSKKSAGKIIFSRISDDSYFTPCNILFYSGKPVDGGGIFALITTQNLYNPDEKGYRAYEISSTFDSWTQVTNFYVPVVMINGRGNKYETAKASNLAYTAQPKFLEARNILTTRFKAYFTSDGQSNAFRLPYSGLANESVMCRIYTSLTEYTEWVIYQDASSDTKTFYTAEITMHVDRSKGMIYFTGTGGKDYPIPGMTMYHENNICVTAGKSFGNGLEEICTLNCCAEYGSKLIFSGGSKNGRVYSVSSANPLYFSEKSVADIGSSGDGITALLTTKNGVIAFKSSETYKIKVRHGSALNTSSLLADNDSVFYEGDTFSQAKLADIGCTDKRTCVLCGSYPVWMSGDGKIYSMNSYSGNITHISEETDDFFNAIDFSERNKAVAVGESGKYWLLFGDKALVMHFTSGESKQKYFLWSFKNIKLLDIIVSGGKRRFICLGSDGRVLYSATESTDNTDTDIKRNSSLEPVTEAVRFTSSFSTKCFDFGTLSIKKFIQSIVFAAASKGKLKISLTGDAFGEMSVELGSNQYNCGSLSVVRLLPHICAVREAGLQFSSEYGMEIGEISFNYREE